MKWLRYAGIAALCWALPFAAYGQTLRQPGAFHPASAIINDNYYTQGQEQPSPSDVPPMSVTPLAPVKAASGGCNCNACDGDDEPWSLFPELPMCFKLNGWIELGVTGNGRPTASRYNGPQTFNDRREFQANQLYAYVERTADTGGCGWDWGARADVLYGTDFVFTQAAGLETPDWNSGVEYGIALPQFYVELAVNRLSVKLGHFYTIMGYEGVMAPNNFFYSHSYTLQYGEPFTHTGGYGEWKMTDRVSLYAGLVDGWDKFEGNYDRANFLGGMRYTPDHGRYSIYWTFIGGEDVDLAGTSSDRWLSSFVFAYDVTDSWQYVLQNDIGYQNNIFGFPSQAAEWYGINQYLFYTINPCWKAGLRFEWFRDDDGVRVAGVRATNPYRGGSAGNFYEVTAGLNWTPTTNLNIRPELRWDWFSGIGTPPYDDNTQDNQFTAAVDLIWRY